MAKELVVKNIQLDEKTQKSVFNESHRLESKGSCTLSRLFKIITIG